METVTLPLNLNVFRRLQSYVEPIVDDQNTALMRIFDHWDATHGTAAKTVTAPLPAKRAHFRTSRGVLLPLGLQMFADWNNIRLTAEVTESGILCDGKSYDDPSGAAKAAKLQRGASDTTASTNGWTFWCMTSPDNKVCTINQFRVKK